MPLCAGFIEPRKSNNANLVSPIHEGRNNVPCFAGSDVQSWVLVASYVKWKGHRNAEGYLCMLYWLYKSQGHHLRGAGGLRTPPRIYDFSFFSVNCERSNPTAFHWHSHIYCRANICVVCICLRIIGNQPADRPNVTKTIQYYSLK